MKHGSGRGPLMPTGDSPHKGRDVSPGTGEMRLACADNEGFVFSDYEIRAPYPSYTIRGGSFVAGGPGTENLALIQMTVFAVSYLERV